LFCWPIRDRFGRLPRFRVSAAVAKYQLRGEIRAMLPSHEDAASSAAGNREGPESFKLTTDEVAALRLIVEETAGDTGDAFFQSLVRHLAAALVVRNAFVAEFADSTNRVHTLAYWSDGRLVENITFELAGTPCEEVVTGKLCHHPVGVQERFPQDQALVDQGIQSYLGVPLTDVGGQVLGHLAVFDPRPMPPEAKTLFIFRIFAARAAAELNRLRMEQMLAASEQRYRDLFDEAPIPYVFEDSDTRFASANRAAMQLLGLKDEDVPGTVGMSLVAPTPENQRKIQAAFEAIRRGEERTLLELELRRKDDGRPVWVQFWSRPEPDGKHTRTMIIDITDRVLAERESARLQQQNAYLQEEIKAALHFDEIVGRSPALAAVLDHVRAVAPTDASVLIMGETGTGKELIARAIHSNSRRQGKPLIKLNCASLPAGLVESELFGHEKGAFTGAIARRIGRFELADGGTIFLDEVGELPLETQAKLLRVLQEREFERLGGKSPQRVDVRVIAATNRDLAEAVAQKSFREDLFYRLNVFPIRLPPLRDRQDDIALLAQYFAEICAARIGKPIDGISRETIERMRAYPWPGNIRELQNVVERAAILATGRVLEIGPELLLGSTTPPKPDAAPECASPTNLETVDRNHILAVLKQTNWRISGPDGAAGILALHPNTLRSRMKKLGISRDSRDIF
jgi:PAS domain S-box-containing protein